MRFLVDAQLPRRLAHRLRDAGHDALAQQEDRVLVTKDTDFMHERILTGAPRLLLVTVGNCTNTELEALLLPNLGAVVEALEGSGFVELTRAGLIVRE